jgi:hypothetical protein
VAEEIPMTAISLHHRTDREAGVADAAIKGLVRGRALVAVFALVFPIGFYLLLLAVLVVEYGHLPNYATPYNWISNVLRIGASTRSVIDMVPIILDEWLFETGYINYGYGRGIAEWSLTIIPHKLAIVSLVGALIGFNVKLLLDQQTTAKLSQQHIRTLLIGALTGAGALCASVTNATVYSVVHCATPSWIGSLAVLGFDSYDVFGIEPFGPIICVLGFVLLAVAALLTVSGGRAAADSKPLQQVKETTSC